MSWRKSKIKAQLVFWEKLRLGYSSRAACQAAGVNKKTGYEWRKAAGGQIPKAPTISPRYLSLEERECIADLRVNGAKIREIAEALGRAASTISREISRNSSESTGKYGPYAANRKAKARASRPKHSKLEHPQLVRFVEDKLMQNWSPEQISRELKSEFEGREEMQVSHETIYQAIFVQGRGQLRRELHQQLRTGRAVRRPRRSESKERSGQIPQMVMISERPAEVEDRAVPGHWEGDLILGADCRSAIGTLVERKTRYLMLVHLPHDHGAESVRDGLLKTISSLPNHLRRSLTWDQGRELARHREISLATELDIYFCDPHSPWQRGSNENTNGLLRQYFPKGTELSVHSPAHLLKVAAELNSRPRKTLGWITPAQAFNRLISDPNHPFVASTP